MLKRAPWLRRTESPSPQLQGLPSTTATGLAAATASRQRMVAIDAIKGAACLLIVAHHLSVYGPMSDHAVGLLPDAIGWLYDYGRWAVQVFLVIGGYLAAASLAPDAHQTRPLRKGAAGLIWRRYCRLALPYSIAVVVSVMVAALVRPWFPHPSVPEAPSMVQAFAHALFLQDIFGFKALSAGLWYVAIDFQLYALSVLVFGTAAAAARRWPRQTMLRGDGAMLVIGLVSLWVFNRNAGLDTTALYFVGTYALGMMAYWAVPKTPPRAPTGSRRSDRYWLAVLIVAGATALLIEFRGRVALAWGVALALVVMRQVFQATAPSANPARRKPWWQMLGCAGVQSLARVGVISYTVFLIHFPVCLLVNAVVAHVWPTGAWANLFGLVVALAVSLAAGSVLFRGVEGVSGLRSAHKRTAALPV